MIGSFFLVYLKIFLRSQLPEVEPTDGSLNWQRCNDMNILSVRDREYLNASLTFFSDIQDRT